MYILFLANYYFISLKNDAESARPITKVFHHYFSFLYFFQFQTETDIYISICLNNQIREAKIVQFPQIFICKFISHAQRKPAHRPDSSLMVRIEIDRERR